MGSFPGTHCALAKRIAEDELRDDNFTVQFCSPPVTIRNVCQISGTHCMVLGHSLDHMSLSCNAQE